MNDKTLKPLLSGPAKGPVRIASIGECMLELAPSAEADQFKKSFAGDALNALWYAKQLEPSWNAMFVSRVGQDQVSDDMLAMMTAAGLDVRHVQRCADRTVGLYMISLKDGERSFAYWRGQSAARQMADAPAMLGAALDDADVVLFSGITLAILEPTARKTLLGALECARAAGKTVVFDPNLRPRLWLGASHMREAILQGASVSDITLPSFDEEAEHFGDATPHATIARYLEAGSKTVVVKNGAGAVHYVHNGQSGQVQPDPVTQLVDTTSAGDSFNAGLLVGMAQFAAIEKAITLASRVARQVIAQRGALVTLDIDAL